MPRTVEPLTDTKIRNAKPRERAYKLFDGGGLHLEIMTDGRKLWRFKYVRPSGAENRLGFGTSSPASAASWFTASAKLAPCPCMTKLIASPCTPQPKQW